jgi:hypothetical protein
MISHDLKCIFFHPNKCGGKSIENAIWGVRPTPGSADHKNAEEYIKEVGKDIVDKYYTFMFCRNPWDRLVSIYFGRKQILKVNMPSFEEFIKLSDPNVKPTKSQLSWIKNDAGVLKLNFLGRFENYKNDWKTLCNNLDIDIELPHLNKSSHRQYQDYYSRELRDIVYFKYKDDIEFFNYRF